MHNLLWCRESMWTPSIDHKKCIGCGVQRVLAWYHKGSASRGLQSKCMLCIALYERQRQQRRRRQAVGSKDPITAKMCRVCNLTLPADSFTADIKSKDGYRSTCRDCRQVEDAARISERSKRSRNQTLVFAKGTERICTSCRIEKPWAEYSKNFNSTSGIRSICKQCINTKKLLQRSDFRKLQVLSDRL